VHSGAWLDVRAHRGVPRPHQRVCGAVFHALQRQARPRGTPSGGLGPDSRAGGTRRGLSANRRCSADAVHPWNRRPPRLLPLSGRPATPCTDARRAFGARRPARRGARHRDVAPIPRVLTNSQSRNWPLARARRPAKRRTKWVGMTAGSIVSRRQRCVTVAGSGRRGTGSTVMCATRVGWLSVPIAPRPPEMLESREQQDWVVSPRETVSHVYGSDEVLLTLGRVVAVVMAAGAGAEVDDKGDGERRGGVRCDGHRVLHAGGPGAHVCGRAVVLLPSGYQGYAPLAKRNETLPSRRLFF